MALADGETAADMRRGLLEERADGDAHLPEEAQGDDLPLKEDSGAQGTGAQGKEEPAAAAPLSPQVADGGAGAREDPRAQGRSRPASAGAGRGKECERKRE